MQGPLNVNYIFLPSHIVLHSVFFYGWTVPVGLGLRTVEIPIAVCTVVDS